MPKGGILCVDDDSLSRRVIEEFLSDSDYELRFAHNGQSCLESIRERRPDIILMDIMLPDLKGFEICQILKADQACNGIKIIFLTMLDTDDVTRHCSDCREIHVLQKPFSADAMAYLLDN